MRSSAEESLECGACGGRSWSGSYLAPDVNLASTTEVFRVWECAFCGSGRTSGRRYSEAALPSYYPQLYFQSEKYDRLILDRVWGFHLRRLEALVTGSTRYGSAVDPDFLLKEEGGGRRAVEIGSGDGQLLMALRGKGWVVLGVDPFSRVSVGPRSLDIEVRAGPVESQHLGSSVFDRAYAVHALEHLWNPLSILAKVRTALKPDGEVVIAVPNFQSPGARFFREKWFELEVPRHVHHFTPTGLRILLNRAGFQLRACYYDDSLEDVVRSLVNMLTKWRIVLDRRSRPMSRIYYLPGEASKRVLVTVLNVIYGPFFRLRHLEDRRYMVVRAAKA